MNPTPGNWKGFLVPGLDHSVPSFHLTTFSIKQAQDFTIYKLILLAPFWPTRPWSPDLLSLLIEPPVVLPLRRDLLRQPLARRFHQNLSMLRLRAWRLSSALQEPKDSLLAWLNDLPVVEGHLL